MKDKPIMQINIEEINNGSNFKHIIKPTSNVEKLALIEYLGMIQEELRMDFEMENIENES